MRQIKKSIVVESTLTQSINNSSLYEFSEFCNGTYYKNKNDTHYIVFENLINDQKVITTIKLKDDELSLIRVGEVHSRYVFNVDKWNTCYYYLSGNSFLLRNYTKCLEYYLSDQGGSIHILYDLWSDSTHLGHYCWDFVLN